MCFQEADNVRAVGETEDAQRRGLLFKSSFMHRQIYQLYESDVTHCILHLPWAVAWRWNWPVFHKKKNQQ